MLRLADRVAEKPTDSWVFSWPGWADHPLMSETGGRWIITLDLQKIARLSVRLFGDKSLYGR
jgi:hypothetical protein